MLFDDFTSHYGLVGQSVKEVLGLCVLVGSRLVDGHTSYRGAREIANIAPVDPSVVVDVIINLVVFD